MSFNFANYKRLDIPEGRVKQIKRKSDGAVLWESGYVNMVPLSIDADGSIYNGTGYIEGYRLSSSGELKDQADTVTTGFIPAGRGDLVRMAGVSWPSTSTVGYSYFVLYDANFNRLDHINMSGSENVQNGWSYSGRVIVDSTKTYVTIDDIGVTTFDIATKNDAEYAYIRISAEGNGADMIVTVNEEIT